jgi:IstB-like ATP binding protein
VLCTREICEDRSQNRSMILNSQLPVTKWHEQIGDPTLADGILDRIMHNAHRMEKGSEHLSGVRGDSMRRARGNSRSAEKCPLGSRQPWGKGPQPLAPSLVPFPRSPAVIPPLGSDSCSDLSREPRSDSSRTS